MSDDQYVVRWFLDGGAAAGTATATGTVNDGRLSLGWTRQNVIGVTVYLSEKGGVLNGHWVTWPGDGKKRDEKMTWEKDFAKDADL